MIANRRKKSVSTIAVVSLALVVLCLESANAGPRLHGVVLAVTPKTGQVIVRHDAFGSMPAMTMAFRIVPRERAAQLQAGASIDADVDTKTEPWTLSNVTSTRAQPLTSDVTMRRVPRLAVGDAVPDTPFVDQTGKPFRLSQLRGQDVVLSFIYTRCADARMCPLISAKFGQLQRLAGARRLHLVEVTLDPTFDRPPVLARYGRAYGADPKRWSLVVGDAEPTLDFAAQFGVAAFPDPNGGIIHAENTVQIDRSGRIAAMNSDTAWLPTGMLADIDARDGLASNPLARLNLWLSNAFAVMLLGVAALAYLIYRVARNIFRKSA